MDDIREIAEDIAIDLRYYAAYIRNDQKKLYLTPIELFLIVAVGVLSSYLKGAISCFKKNIEDTGREHAEVMLAKFDRILDKLIESAKPINSRSAESSKDVSGKLLHELIEVADNIDYSEIQSNFDNKLQQKFILDYLMAVGLPADIAEDLSCKLVLKIERQE